MEIWKKVWELFFENSNADMEFLYGIIGLSVSNAAYVAYDLLSSSKNIVNISLFMHDLM